MKYLIILFIFISCTQEGKVTAVYDGDTVTMLSDGKNITIRLAEIDAPELGQPFGIQAKNYLSSLLAGKTIISYKKDIDKYGRIVCQIYVGDTWINEKMVTSGYAWCYKKYSSALLYSEQQTARENKIGLWSAPAIIPPYLFRKQHP